MAGRDVCRVKRGLLRGGWLIPLWLLSTPLPGVEKADWPWWGGALALSFALDGVVEAGFPRSRRDPWGWRWVNAWGGPQALAVPLGLWAAGAVRREWREDGAAMLRAAAVGVSFTGLVKWGSGRLRPDAFAVGEADPGRWFSGGDAFPSGHATLAFALSTAWAERRPRPFWQRAAAYALAGGTALARIRYRRHWLSDVVAGAAVGVFAGRWAAGGGGSSWRFTPQAMSWSQAW